MSEGTSQIRGDAKRLGIIAAPGWFDPTHGEFARRHKTEELLITQTIMPPVGFGWSFAEMAGAEEHIETAARLLAEAGSQVIIEVGPAFSYQIGGDPAGGQALQQRLSVACGVPVILNGVAVLNALEATGARRIAIACPYYNPEWKAKFLTFLQGMDFAVAGFGTFVEQGIFSSQADVDARHYQFTASEAQESIRRTLAAASGAEAIIIGGSGVRTLDWIEDFEAELGIPLISADRTLYSAAVAALGLPSKVTV